MGYTRCPSDCTGLEAEDCKCAVPQVRMRRYMYVCMQYVLLCAFHFVSFKKNVCMYVCMYVADG